MSNCPCGSGKEYERCCEPYIKGDKFAETAEILMRSRYTAYVKLRTDYIVLTNAPETRERINRDAIKTWAESADWQSLVILETINGKSDDQDGIVEFQAIYKLRNVPQIHHERSLFNKIDDKWYYSSQEKISKLHKENMRIGRNSPCPCGSGKKYKKCCG